MREYDVYRALIDFLSERGWSIICASPPGGTNGRYSKCILPRRSATEKGPRDEVDLSASGNGILLLAECKVKLSESLTKLTRQNESDYDKLLRLIETWTPGELSRQLSRAYGNEITCSKVGGVLAVTQVDRKVPPGITVLEFRGDVHAWASDPFVGVFS